MRRHGGESRLSHRIAHARDLMRPNASDPLRDLATGSVRLATGVLDFVHPRAPIELIYEQRFADDEEYPPYWAELWPSGIQLAVLVADEVRPDARVVELGCGLGLPSVAAALGGASVLATDRSADAIALTEMNARCNGVAVRTAVCDWARPDGLVERGRWDLVLASDVLYERRDARWLRDLLPELVAPGGQVWIADPRRPQAEEFFRSVAADWRSVRTVEARAPEVTITRLSGLR